MEIFVDKLESIVKEVKMRKHNKIKILGDGIFSQLSGDKYWEVIDLN